MSTESNPNHNSDYYSARAAEERRLAMASSDTKVRAIHLEHAERYSELASDCSAAAGAPEVIGEQQQQAG